MWDNENSPRHANDLLEAASTKDTAFFDLLICVPEYHLILNQHRVGSRCLMFAIQNHDYQMIRSLVYLNPYLFDWKNSQIAGSRPLNFAVKQRDIEIMKTLIEFGDADPATPDPTDCDNRPLHHACILNSLEMVNWLIGFQTVRDTIDAQNAMGRTPLSYAAEFRHKDIVQLLLKFETVDPLRYDHAQNNAYIYASNSDNRGIVDAMANTLVSRKFARSN